MLILEEFTVRPKQGRHTYKYEACYPVGAGMGRSFRHIFIDKISLLEIGMYKL